MLRAGFPKPNAKGFRRGMGLQRHTVAEPAQARSKNRRDFATAFVGSHSRGIEIGTHVRQLLGEKEDAHSNLRFAPGGCLAGEMKSPTHRPFQFRGQLTQKSVREETDW